MLFKDTKSGYPVYILNRDEMTAKQGKVINVGAPYFEPQKPGQLSPSTARLVDVTVETDGKTQTYAIGENTSVAYAGNIVLSLDCADILREVQAIKSQSEEVIKSIDKHKGIVERSETILQELDTAYKEKRETDKRIDTIQSEVKGIKDEVGGLSKMITDFISNFKRGGSV